MEKLTKQLDELIDRLSNSKEFRSKLDDLKSVYPFSEYEYIISHLLAAKKLSIDEYYKLRDDYINRNLYLYLFEMAPRTFGDTWGLSHVCSIESEFRRPSKKVDDTYKGEYNLYLDWRDQKDRKHFIKIEVKASRANDRERKEDSPIIKAIASDSKRPFLMNFQQQKPKCCDVFIWIAVYRDQIKYWVINSNEVQRNRYFTPQHRNLATAERKKNYKKEDIYEGQIMITEDNISDFGKFISSGSSLKESVIAQYKVQHKLK
ncbi:hypothetical protein HY768_05255 [candidate division TA06 bacterium]|uniref:Uncharacterized protein n=1 Tax=candidate division TA06 bacterium TaxID=2250710 RepID=A0A933I9D2_UNCT6|nr:hypothetical protein [candidate division TA06 bacterium]